MGKIIFAIATSFLIAGIANGQQSSEQSKQQQSQSVNSQNAPNADVVLRETQIRKLSVQQYKERRLLQHYEEQKKLKRDSENSQNRVTSVRATRYEDVVEFLKQLQAQYPQTTELFDLAMNDDNVMIKGIKIGHGPLRNLMVATHHGNEYGSTEVAKAFAASLAKDPISDQTIYVIPVLNINGYNKNNRYETAKSQQRDPNRDYPGPCGTEGPFKLKSTQALANFIAKENIVSSMTLHTYWPAVAYPWGVSTKDVHTADEAFFEKLVKIATQDNNYFTGTSTDVLYPADGTFEDYAYWKHGIWSLLFEMGTGHSPNPTAIEKMVRENVANMKMVFKNSPLERSKNHDFKGNCSARLRSFDPHIE